MKKFTAMLMAAMLMVSTTTTDPSNTYASCRYEGVTQAQEIMAEIQRVGGTTPPMVALICR